MDIDIVLFRRKKKSATINVKGFFKIWDFPHNVVGQQSFCFS